MVQQTRRRLIILSKRTPSVSERIGRVVRLVFQRDEYEVLQELVETYALAAMIECKAFTAKGNLLACCRPRQDGYAFCQLIQCSEKGCQDCQKSYVYGGLQAEKLGEAYIYFCPYGLVNWAVPVLHEDELRCFITAGPVLMHPVDSLMISYVVEQNRELVPLFPRVTKALYSLPVTEPLRVRHLAKLLFRVAQPLMPESLAVLEKRQQAQATARNLAEVIHRLKGDLAHGGGRDSSQAIRHSFERETELISRVRLGDKRGAQRVLNEILGSIYFHSGSQFEIVKSRAVEVMVVLARAAIEVGADLELVFGLEYTYLEQAVTVRDMNQLSLWLIKVLDRFIECAFSLKNMKNRDLIFRAMDFIRSKYNKDITLEDVAGEVGLNPSYFSKLFKKEMNTSYTEYLNRVRIEAAKKLVRQDMPLVDVTHMVGFCDQSYFSKVFKRIEGMPPGKWRSSMGYRRQGRIPDRIVRE